MRRWRFATLLLLLSGLAALPTSASSARSAHPFHALTAADRGVLSHAARIAYRSRAAALRWLRQRQTVVTATMGPDRTTIEARFRDSAGGLIFDSSAKALDQITREAIERPAPHERARDGSAPRALVMEPFGIQLDLGLNSGQPEIDALQRAGFQVDVYRENAVTIPTIESMGQYSVVYMESHSGTCGPPLCSQDDVFVLTGVQVTGSLDQYASLFDDGSLTEGVPDTEPGNIYLAFTSQLLTQHVQRFPDSSIVFINGCDLLAEPAFLKALTALGAASVFTWNKKVYNFDAEPAADFIFKRLADGATVSTALSDARAAGLGTSTAEDGTTLTAFGDGDNTFAKALAQATPTPTPTPVPTAASTPTPAPTPKPTRTVTCGKGHTAAGGRCVKTSVRAKCKKGYKRMKGKCKKVKG